MLHSSRFTLSLLILALGVGLGLRVAISLSDSLWLDEQHTAWSTAGELNQVAPRAAAGNQSPLYFWSVWLIRNRGLEHSFDNNANIIWSTFVVRLISVIAGWGVIWGSAILVWKWTRSEVACWVVAWLTCVESNLLFYATEARPYALMQLLSLIQVGLFWSWLQGAFQVTAVQPTDHPRNNSATGCLSLLCRCGAILSVVTGLMIATQITSFGLILAEGMFLAGYSGYRLATLGRRDRQIQMHAWKSAVWVAVLTLVIIAPMFRYGADLYAARENWQTISQPVALLNEVQLSLRWSLLMPLVAIGLFRLAGTSGNSISIGRKRDEKRMEEDLQASISLKLVFVACWALLPIGGAILLENWGSLPLANRRYVQVAMPALPVFTALCVAAVGFHWQRAALSTVALLATLILSPWLIPLATSGRLPQFRWEDWSSPIEEINRHAARDDAPIILFANLLEDRNALEVDDLEFQAYLRFALNGIPTVNKKTRSLISYPTLTRFSMSETDLQRIERQGGAWILIRGNDLLTRKILFDFLRQLNVYFESRELLPADWWIELASFEQSPWSDVKLFWIGPRAGR